MTSTRSHEKLIEEFTHIAGREAVVTQPDLMRTYCTDWRGIFHGKTFAVLRPKDTQECAALIKICHREKVVIVPQGGNTGLVGGATPSQDPSNVIISLTRMRQIEGCDGDHFTLLCQAGVTLLEAQEEARKHDMLLPLSISSEGTATIGGVMSTNAGGNNTLCYGNARERMIGLEIVLADGSILDLLSDLRKDNTGYALRQLFVGAEGTLGIITRIRMRLMPSIKQCETALCAVPNPAAALGVLSLFKKRNPQLVHACEYMSSQSMKLVEKYIDNARIPLPTDGDHDWLLIEIVSADKDVQLEEMMEDCLGQAMEDGLVEDAVLAESDQQREALWLLREEHSQSQKMAGASVKNDISLPLKNIPEFIKEGTDLCHRVNPNILVAAFGHIGDGNIHFNLVEPQDKKGSNFQEIGDKLEYEIGALAVKFNGSFSAEHGIGQKKQDMMRAWKNPVELQAMLAVKKALDPENIMNPGKLLPLKAPN